jgi:hypothetical protein
MVKALEEKGLLPKICSNSVDRIPLEDREVQRLLAGGSVEDNSSVHMDDGRQKVGSKKLEILRKRPHRLEKEADFRHSYCK